MKAFILAAGYATRLYPLTKDRAKPLLPVAGRPIIDYLIDLIGRAPRVNGVHVVTNHRFYHQFEAWAGAKERPLPISVWDDGTTSESDRLGAVGDLDFLFRRVPLDDDVLVLAGDNVLEFDLNTFIDAFRRRSDAEAAVTVIQVTDVERLRRTGVATVGDDGWVLDFREKPRVPQSHWAVPPLYLFRKEVTRRVAAFLGEGGEADAPGHFIAWLVQQGRVLAHRFEGERYDIGTPESYREVQRIFSSRPS